MSNALYALYQRSVFELAQTMVVKHSEVAAALNAGLKEIEMMNASRGVFFGTDPLDPTTWKYFCNLAGEYHSYDEWKLEELTGHNRIRIKVAGLTGPVNADFTRELVESDPALANEYRYGAPLYKELLDQYPDFQDLIDGIMNPVDKQVAIAAKDGDILYAGGYHRRVVQGKTQLVPVTIAGRRPPNLIEENETNLLPRLEFWIKGFLYRWHNRDYAQTNDLYVAAMLGVLYAQIPKVIMNIRLDNCHTAFVHSYHVREYLASNGGLHVHAEALAKKELLWLYRNLRYLEKHMGKQETFDKLIEKIATPSNIPLAGFDLRHKLTDMEDTLYPDVTVTRETINFRAIGTGSDVRTIGELLNKEAPLARQGDRDLTAVEAEIIQEVKTRSQSGRLQTKAIESAIVDLTDSIPYPFGDTLIDLLIYHASRGTYSANIYVTNPTSGERILMSPKQAVIVMFYCFNKAWADVTLTTIPSIPARLIPRTATAPQVGLLPRPTRAELEAVVDAEYIPADFIDGLLASNVTVPQMSSTDDFYDYARAVHRELMERYNAYAGIEDSIGRAMGEEAAMLLYWPQVDCPLSEGELYVDWFADNGIDFTGFQTEDYEKLAVDILQSATGSGDSTNRQLADRQYAVIAILRYLSSYGIQYLSSISDGKRLPVAWSALRLTNVNTTAYSDTPVETTEFTMLELQGRAKQSVQVDLAGDGLAKTPTALAHSSIVDHHQLVSQLGNRQVQRFKVPLSSLMVRERTPDAAELSSLVGNTNLPGFVYPDWPTLDEQVPNQNLDGFDYPT